MLAKIPAEVQLFYSLRKTVPELFANVSFDIDNYVPSTCMCIGTSLDRQGDLVTKWIEKMKCW